MPPKLQTPVGSSEVVVVTTISICRREAPPGFKLPKSAAQIYSSRAKPLQKNELSRLFGVF
jgi:hypothetical protein